jgi:hypothetical protein
VMELEAAGRKERRVERLRRASKLPPGKTFETLDKTRVPRTALLKVLELSRVDAPGDPQVFDPEDSQESDHARRWKLTTARRGNLTGRAAGI